MPNVARALGLVLPNHGVAAEPAALAVALLQVLPAAAFRFTLSSTLPLLPAPGLLKFKLALPLLILPVPVKRVSHAFRFER